MERSAQKGFTLVEIMVVMAILAVLSAIAVPTYRDYTESVKMSKTNLHFQQAVSLTTNTFGKEAMNLAIGKASSRPQNQQQWLALYLEAGGNAPGGGPAYVPGNDVELVGAIGVAATADGREVILRRSAYLDLTPKVATITPGGVVISDSN